MRPSNQHPPLVLALALSLALQVSSPQAKAEEPGSADSARTVFVTSQAYTGNLGGLSGADAICQSLADAAGVPGTFRAWLSDSTGSPSTRFDRNGGPFVTVDGTIVADDWYDLVADEGGLYLRQPIDLTETGSIVEDNVWTATAVDGSADASMGDCYNWSADEPALEATYGWTYEYGKSWTGHDSQTCYNPARLYCFSQTPGSSDYLDNTDNQQLSIAGDTLHLTSDDGADTVDLSPYLDNTDSQTVSLSGNTLTISGSGTSVDLESLAVVAELLERMARVEWLGARRMFVTSERYTGDLGGLDGADAICQSVADAAGLYGTYRAWLSDSTISAADRLTPDRDRPIQLVDGTLIANNWLDLLDSELFAPINRSEEGALVENPVWTATSASGDLQGTTCLDWQSVSSDEFGRIGSPGFADRFWSSSGNKRCNGTRSLYCLSD